MVFETRQDLFTRLDDQNFMKYLGNNNLLASKINIYSENLSPNTFVGNLCVLGRTIARIASRKSITEHQFRQSLIMDSVSESCSVL